MRRRNFIAHLFAAPAALAVANERPARPGPASTVIEQEIVINTTDPDVDRLMAGFISYAERQSDKMSPYGGRDDAA